MRRLFILRPQPAADATAGRARELGLDPVVVPLFRVEPVEWAVPAGGAFDALLLTSANAVRHGGPKLEAIKRLPAHAVGAATSAAARKAGFEVVTTGTSGVDGLLQSLPTDLRFLHLCGLERREPTVDRMITAVPVYRSVAVAQPDLEDLPGNIVMVHSPRAAARLAELVSDRSSIRVAAVSEAAARAAGGGWELVAVAGTPSGDALLATAAKLCDKADGQ